LLETIRSFGLERLAAFGEEETVRARHLAHYRDLSERYERDRFTPRQLEWIARLTAEHANLRAALEFGLSSPDDAAVAMEIAARLWNFWFAGGYLREGLRWLERALAVNPEPSPGRGRALWTCAFLSAQSGKAEQAAQTLAEGWALAEELGDPLLRAHLALADGQAALFTGDLVAAVAHLEAALREHRELGDLQGVADSLILLAGVRFFLQDPSGADAAQEVLELCEQHGTEWTKTYALWAVALHHWLAGDSQAGLTAARDAMRMERTARDWTGVAYLLEVLAWCAGALGEAERCAKLLGGAVTTWRLSGARADDAPPYHAIDELVAQQGIAAIGREAFEAARAAGMSLTVEELFDLALDEETERGVPEVQGGREEDPLTPREREIAGLVAEGLTNRQIAARLTISPRTAEGHVERILSKLGFTSRTQIVAWMTGRR
jgi:DNA-binding CsgD family transcriptional regulator